LFAPLRLTALLLAGLLLSGCATVDGPKNPRDPLEGYNRAMFEFNDDFDRALFRPLAEGYDKVMPQPVNSGISNFFSNLDDILVLLNDLLQLKFEQGLSDLGRITWNTTAGLFGFIDVATHMDLPKHDEDFGQTLGYWGVGSGPYLVLPFLGPSTVRDGSAMVATWQVAPLSRLEDERLQTELLVLRAVDTRAGLLRATRILETAALDPYAFMRDAYLQRRQNQVYDGNPPLQNDFDPFAEEFDPLAEPLDEEAPAAAP
jgi:phospholipid-binding lipoprotein MlaA